MVKDVTQNFKNGGRGMLEYLCRCRVSYRILSFGRVGGKFCVDVERVIAHNNYRRGSWGMLP